MVAASARALIAAILRRPRLVASVTAVAVVAAVAIPLTVTTVDHANADAAYQRARTSLSQVSAQLTAARTTFTEEHARVAALSAQLAQVQSGSHGYLTDAQLSLVTSSVDHLGVALALLEGGRPTPPAATGTSGSTTAELQSATATLTTQRAHESGWLETTRRSTSALLAQDDLATSRLVAIALGTAATSDHPALPGLDSASTAVLAAYPRADQSAKDALAAAVTAAKKAASAHQPIGTALLAYLAKAAAVHDSQAAVDAAAAAAAAKAAAAAAASASAHDTSNSSTSSGSAAPPAHTYSPPPNVVNHTPHVIAGVVGAPWVPGCTPRTFMTKQFSQDSHLWVMAISEPYPFDYDTFSTPDGWGADIYKCG